MMKSTFRQRLAVSCLLSLCLAALFGALMSPKVAVPPVTAQDEPDPRPCESLRAEATGKDGVLALYAKLKTFDKDGRKQFYRLINGKDQAKLWALHFRTYMLDHDLSDEQQQFFDHLLSVIKGRDFKNATDKAYVLSQVVGLEERGAQLFKADTPLLFTRLGGAPAASGSSYPNCSVPATPRKGALAFEITTRWNCDCNREIGSFFCNWEIARENCTTTACNGSADGCGYFWLYPCNGLCCGPWTPCY